MVVFFFKQKTAYEMRISDWSSDVCSSDLDLHIEGNHRHRHRGGREADQPMGAQPRRMATKLAVEAEQQSEHARGPEPRHKVEVDPVDARRRADGRRVGKEGDRTGRSRGSRDTLKTKVTI